MAKNNLQSVDTIVALATPPAAGALAIIRISGPDADKVAAKVFKPLSITKLKPRELTLGWVYSGSEKIDQAMAVAMPRPNSYTGEDVLEIHLHGSPAVVATVLDTITKLSFVRPATAGEFTKRAFLNNKIDLLQAEAVAELIASKNKRVAASASHQLNGELSKQIRACKEQVIGLSAFYIANLDFSEEDVASLQPSDAKKVLRKVQEVISTILQNAKHQKIIREGIRVSLIGLPNAGKSTLLNMLLGYERAIVTATAGTTRDVLSETVLVGGIECVITDTAGLRESADSVEKIGIERTKHELSTSDYVFVLVEPGQQSKTQKYITQNKLLGKLSSQNTFVIFTKADKATQEPSKYFARFQHISVAKNNTKSVQKVITLLETINKKQEIESIQILTTRQENLLQEAEKQTSYIIQMIHNKATDDIALVEVQKLIEIFNTLSGEHTTEEMLVEVFSSFCIGK